DPPWNQNHPTRHLPQAVVGLCPALGPITTARAPGDGRPAEGPDPPVRLGRPGREVPPAMFTPGPEGEPGPGRSRRRSALPAAGRTPAAHAPKEKAGQDQMVLFRLGAPGPAAGPKHRGSRLT